MNEHQLNAIRELSKRLETGQISAEQYSTERDRLLQDGGHVAPGAVNNTSLTPANVSFPERMESDYGVAKSLASFFVVIGWLMVLGGAVFVVVGLADRGIESFGNFLAGVILVVAGLFQVASSQLIKAVADNADYSREILRCLQASVHRSNNPG